MANFTKLPTQGEVRSRTNSNMNKLQGSLSKAENNIRLQQSQSFVGSSNDPFSTPTRDNYQTYPYDYYAGADCKVFFGDIWVDDIVAINYNLSQSKTPIYGYASQYFDAIAKGQVIVQGSMMIAFKETGYLNIIQATLESQRVDASKLIQAKIDKYEEDAKTGTAVFVPRLNTIGESTSPEQVSLNFSANGSPQIIRQQQTIEQILIDKKVNTSTAVNKTLGIDNKTRDFEDFAEILEDSLWGDNNGHPITLNNKLKRADEFDYNPNGGITISKNNDYSSVLNIMLTFGDINDFRAEHTITILNDVHFTSVSTIVSPTGDPIGEEYNFIAKTINDSISNSSVINIDPIKLMVGTDAVLSTLENVKAVENYLANNNSDNIVDLRVEAGVVQGDRWDTIKSDLGTYNFYPNRITPFVDQLCAFVENSVNSLVNNQLNPKYFQFIITANFGPTDKITMILQQTVPNTKTYKVISPTRSGFSAVNIITRDDLFAAKAMEPMEPPKQAIPKVTEEAKKQVSIDEGEKVQSEFEVDIEKKYESNYAISPENAAKIAESTKTPSKVKGYTTADIQKINERWGAQIEEAAKALDSKIPNEFVAAIILQESGGNVNAKSSFPLRNKDGTPKLDKNGKQVYGHAEGITQMISSTYGNAIQNIQKDYPNVKITSQVGVYSPNNAILAATYELNRLYELSGGDLAKVAAAYNGGPGAIQESRKDPGKLVYESELNKGYAETRKYVPGVIDSYNNLIQSKNSTNNSEGDSEKPALEDRKNAIKIENDRKQNEFNNKNNPNYYFEPSIGKYIPKSDDWEYQER